MALLRWQQQIHPFQVPVSITSWRDEFARVRRIESARMTIKDCRHQTPHLQKFHESIRTFASRAASSRACAAAFRNLVTSSSDVDIRRKGPTFCMGDDDLDETRFIDDTGEKASVAAKMMDSKAAI